MAINWALGNPNAPEEVAEAFRLGGERRKVQSVLAQYGTDPAGATRSAFESGNPDLAKTVRGFQAEDAERKNSAAVESLTAYRGWMEKLASIPDEAARDQLRQRMLADPSTKWMPPDAVEAARSAPLDNASMALYLKKIEEKIYEVEHGKAIVGVTPGQPAREIYVRPEKPEYHNVPADTAAFPVGGNVVRGLIPDAPAGDTTVPVQGPPQPPDPNGPAVQPAAREQPDTLAQAVESLFPGAHVTSTQRSAAHNAAVGGVANSRHLQRGGAVDFVPPRGVSTADAAAQMEAKYGGRAIDEDDHVHWQPAENLRGGATDDALIGAQGADMMAGGGQSDGFVSPDGRPVLRGPSKPNPDRITPALQEQMRHNRVVEQQADTRLRPGGKGLPADERKYIAQARTSAQQMQTLSTDMQRFVELNKKVSTGPNQLQRGVEFATNPRYKEMKSIQDKLTPAMRQGLPGAASDRDVAMFASAAPSVDKFGPTNQSIASAARAYAKRQLDYVAYMEDYAKRNGTILGAEEEWGIYAESSPLFGATKDGGLRVLPQEPWRKWFGVPVPQGRRGPQGGADASKMSDAQIKAALGLK